MKKVGILGGMGPESTVAYYHDIVFGVQQKLARPFFPDLSIESLNLFEIVELCREKKYGELTLLFKSATEKLACSGADFAVLTANTSHIVFDRLREVSPIPLLSIVEATCREAVRMGFKRLGLLGTIFTMQENFFKEPFQREGIEIVVPSLNDMEYVSEKIYGELEFGVVKEETLVEFQRIISDMETKNAIDAVVLGCTELPLILNNHNSPVPCLDTMKIHIAEIVDRIVE